VQEESLGSVTRQLPLDESHTFAFNEAYTLLWMTLVHYVWSQRLVLRPINLLVFMMSTVMGVTMERYSKLTSISWPPNGFQSIRYIQYAFQCIPAGL
jgi:hypothetical protein